MAINSINNYVSAASTVATDSKVSSKKTESSKNDTSTGVIYEKGSSDKSSSSQKTQNSALIAKMKADSDSRISQLRGIVEQMMSKQGAAIGKADDMWSFLAGGNFTVSADVKAQAQADIAEDGYSRPPALRSGRTPMVRSISLWLALAPAAPLPAWASTSRARTPMSRSWLWSLPPLLC